MEVFRTLDVATARRVQRFRHRDHCFSGQAPSSSPGNISLIRLDNYMALLRCRLGFADYIYIGDLY